MYAISSKYYKTPTPELEAFVESEINKYGLDAVLLYNFTSLDCTRIGYNGKRLMQTIGKPYIKVNTIIKIILDKYVTDEEKLKEYYAMIRTVHKTNLEYENENPPEIYDKRKIKTSKRNTKKEKIIDGLEDYVKPKRKN